MNLWMLNVGRFLTGVAGGMTAASIPVGVQSWLQKQKQKKKQLLFVIEFSSRVCPRHRFTSPRSPTEKSEELWAPALRSRLCSAPWLCIV